VAASFQRLVGHLTRDYSAGEELVVCRRQIAVPSQCRALQRGKAAGGDPGCPWLICCVRRRSAVEIIQCDVEDRLTKSEQLRSEDQLPRCLVIADFECQITTHTASSSELAVH
jgi:hypothetical protein